MKKIYVCGPTVYNDVHIGNMRPILTFDLMLKGLRETKTPFKFIHNITDIDDKIIKRAIDLKTSEKEVSTKYMNLYFELLKMLDIDTVSKFEKVTDNMELIINFINELIKSGNAYQDKDGNVWFDVKKNEKYYGIVSKQQLDKMNFDDEINENKHFKADFALWKKTNVGIKFNAPFGEGRPGWHTECVVLINKHFKGQTIDIHGGGMDLTFPHHENENIQHYALYKKPLANQWFRCGQINLEGVKMSKSLGNIILAKDFIEKHGPSVLKLIILSSKISTPINITNELISNMKTIEMKYQKLIFKFLTTFNDFLKEKTQFNKDDYQKIMIALSNGDFANYNFLINEQIKNFNKNKDLATAQLIYKVLSIIHPEITNKNRYTEALNDFSKWTIEVTKKNYQKADEIREKMIKECFY